MQENICPGTCFPATEVLESTTGFFVLPGEMEPDVGRGAEPINNQSSWDINVPLPHAGVWVLTKAVCTECFSKLCRPSLL